MQIKRIICPNCSTVLDVKNSKNEAVKLITCPSCKVPLRVKFGAAPPPQQPLDALSYKATDQEEAKTHILSRKTKKADRAEETIVNKKPYLKVGNTLYALRPGENTIGRKATTSTASVQIDTNDLYMSRRHVCINIRMLSTGKIQATLRNDHNKNTTLVNKQPLEEGDEVVLNDGSSFQIGDTTVYYIEKNK